MQQQIQCPCSLIGKVSPCEGEGCGFDFRWGLQTLRRGNEMTNENETVSIVDWFDPTNPSHLDAYIHLMDKAFWPEGFIPPNVTIPPTWHVSLAFKLSEAYLTEYKRCNIQC